MEVKEKTNYLVQRAVREEIKKLEDAKARWESFGVYDSQSAEELKMLQEWEKING